MPQIVRCLNATYDDYKIIEYIYAGNTYSFKIINTKTNKTYYPIVFDGVFQSTYKQLRRYLKYLVNNSQMRVSLK